MSAPYAPAPEEIGGYPWWIRVWPWTIVALAPVWFIAAVGGWRVVQLVIAPWFVGFALGKAVWEIKEQRADQRKWRQLDQEYLRWWLRRHGS